MATSKPRPGCTFKKWMDDQMSAPTAPAATGPDYIDTTVAEKRYSSTVGKYKPIPPDAEGTMNSETIGGGGDITMPKKEPKAPLTPPDWYDQARNAVNSSDVDPDEDLITAAGFDPSSGDFVLLRMSHESAFTLIEKLLEGMDHDRAQALGDLVYQNMQQTLIETLHKADLLTPVRDMLLDEWLQELQLEAELANDSEESEESDE